MLFSVKSFINILALSAFVDASPISYDQDLVVRDTSLSQSDIDMLVKRTAMPKKKKGKKAKKGKAKRDDTPEDSELAPDLEADIPVDAQSLTTDTAESPENDLTKRSPLPKKKKGKKGKKAKKAKKGKAKRDEDQD
ncbi:hypothetical protein HK103_001293 [Boothiomyces macroporosus]|uniref:Uncharacterized protein n=1 Tax=Boothiomyces macroporosus TaxID=261099 RepID=A0AAD5Y5F0_9FUNG|nr:hypothetical protein HK103_001293 [Boothiomyces macroporosus]